MSKIVLLVKLTAQPGNEEGLLEELKLMVQPTRKEPGCLRYDLNYDPAHKDIFWFVEEWADESALDRHNQTAHFKKLQERKSALVANAERVLLQPVS
ncbi:MAG TPA: putative quinol monooxygenase [Candidatus Obscuribacterales bacterium]